jgi:nitrogen PTS system EIIA component
MQVLSALSTKCMAAQTALADKSDALRHIARLAKNADALTGVTEEDILAGLQRREALGTTAFGGGIAIPHCRLDGVESFVVGLITVPDGVAFDAADGEDVRIIAFIIGHPRPSNEHVHILSGISQALMVPGAVEELLAAPTPEALLESMTRYVRDEPDADEETPEWNLFHVFVQDETMFDRLLGVLTGLGATSTVVVNAENAGVYLARVPLFADMWSTKPERFCRILVATVSQRLTNEAIRRIERVTGPLKQRQDVMVTVQNIFFAAGSVGS